jgi:hypothetical protein
VIAPKLNDMRKSYKRPFIDISCKMLLNVAKQFQRRFLEINQPETRIAHMATMHIG